MAISDDEFATWAKQGSIQQSASTYQAIKRVLEDPGSPYASRGFSVFLQGSYGNDTNVYAESDVDIVIRLDDVYDSDLTGLSAEARLYWDKGTPPTYRLQDFQQDVTRHVRNAYGQLVVPGAKALRIEANGSRRDADVIVAQAHRKYLWYVTPHYSGWSDGITFQPASGARIHNFPKLHSDKLTEKHQRTSGRFKPTVRVFKNMRNKLVASGAIADDVAPSYFLECLLFNVPDSCFVSSMRDTFVNVFSWLVKADRTTMMCAHGLHRLFDVASKTAWTDSKMIGFMAAIAKRWIS